MKVSDKLRKEKSGQLKPTALKKPDSKKNSLKKDEPSIPRCTYFSMQHSDSPMVTPKIRQG